MIWKKLKKAIIPLIIIKLVIIVFFIVRSDTITISRDMNYGANYNEGFDGDTLVQKRQKFIRIVRNEEKHGISIQIRGRKNAKPLREKEGELPLQMID